MYGKVNEDGTGSVTVITSAFWVGAVMDRLDRASRAAKLAGDQRTLGQLESDIARTLLAVSTVGFADLPDADGAGDGVLAPTDEDLIRAGWTPELVQALSGLPPAVLQVIVPLIGLHDPVTADTLPATGRASTRPDPNAPTQRDRGEQSEQGAQPAEIEPVAQPAESEPVAQPAENEPVAQPSESEQGEGSEHTGRAGCPACTPSRRARPTDDSQDEPVRDAQDAEDGSARETCTQEGRQGSARRVRRLWVGELMGAFRMFLSPSQVRQLALAPGTTMARLLVDPADGRCVERSITTYRMDAAMRVQLLAADVTCRAPGCHHPGAACQVDHVTEYGTPGGATSESNGQLLHTGHHEPKTAKAWDAELAANRDITWTSLLGRIYRTRAWDYRRCVTLLVDAVEAVRSAPPEDRADELNRQVYLALTHRDLGERLNPGDDDLEPDIVRFGGWGLVHLTHRDPRTGEQAPGPSQAAMTDVLASRATYGPPDPPDPDATGRTAAEDRRGPAGAEGTGEPADRQPAPEGLDPDWFHTLPPEEQAWVAQQLENLIYFANLPEF